MTAPPRELARAVEDLRAPCQALRMATDGIAAALHAQTATADGVYHLLEAVGQQLNDAVARLERLTGGG